MKSIESKSYSEQEHMHEEDFRYIQASKNMMVHGL